jgi:small subunit ribosomal protein S1
MTEELNISEEPQQVEENQQPIENNESIQQEETVATESTVELQEDVVETKEEKTEETPVEEVQEIKAEESEPKKSRKPRIEAQPAIIPNTDDFNWDELGKDQQIYSETEQRQLEDIYNQTFNAIVEQEVVEVTIVSKNKREVVVNIGFKSDGVIPANELRYLENLKIGDKVEVYVESQEDASGQLLLSHKKARLLKSWERVNQAHDTNEIITGHVKSKTKGGLIVDVFGIEAFLPGSQIDVKPIRDYDVFVDKTMEFKVVKINHEFKNVVVSHKALIESELEAQRVEIMSGLEKGQVLEGVVKNITNYGAFIDLGGVDGLIHITDLSWGRVTDPKEVLELDQKINVVILDFDESKKRIALGLKQLTPHPWDALDANLQVGDKVTGKVVVIADYGAFIEIMQGVEGLIHVSEMSWSQHLRTAQDFLTVGQEIEAVILTLDREERKMSLGIKQLIPDPWITIAEKYPIGSRHTAVVRNFTNFGIFVELEEGVDGLIHISDLSWSKKIKHPAEFTKIGEQIDVVVLEMDAENRRLSLGHKQLEENPWDVFETIYTIGSIHQGTVANQNDKGAVINLQGVEGFAFNRGLQREDGTTIRPGETEEFKVLEFSKENKKIVLSHAKIWQDAKDAQRDEMEDDEKRKAKEGSKAAKKLAENLEKSTLGDLDALVNLKEELEQEEKTKKAVKVEKVEKTEEKVPVVEEAIEEKPKKTRAKKTEEEAPEAEVATEEKPKKTTRAKKTEETPETEEATEEKPKKTRAKKEDKKESSEE